MAGEGSPPRSLDATDPGRTFSAKISMTPAMASTAAGSSNCFGFSPPDTAPDFGASPPECSGWSQGQDHGFSPPQSARFSSRFDELRSGNSSVISNARPSPKRESLSDSRISQSLNSARSLRRAVDNQFTARPKPLSNDWGGTGVGESLKKRVAVSEGLVHLLNQRIEGTEACIRKVKQMLTILSQNRELLDPGLKIVRRRLDIRCQRPEEETCDDEFQQALEHERRVAEYSKQSLGQHIVGGSALEEALSAAKAVLIEDLLFKKNTLRLEKSALQFDPYHGRDRACVLPLVSQAASSRPGDVPKADQQENVMRTSSQTQELVARAKALEENAGRFQNGSAELLMTVKREVQEAAVNSYQSMRMNIAALFQQKKILEKEVAQSQSDVNRSKSLLASMQHEMKNQKSSLIKWEDTPDIPLDMFDQRLPLSVQQDMRNTAIGRMQEQATFARNNADILEMQCKGTSELLEQLKASHKDLEQSLESKSIAWQVDLACSKVALSGQTAGQVSPRPKPPPDSVLQFLVPRPLSEAAANQIRSKIKAAAYTGPNGQGFDEIFGRLDKDGSGALEPEEVRSALRRSLRVPASVISDQEISSLCGMLDTDNSGAVSIQELVIFVGAESLEGKRGVLKDKLMENLGLQKTGGAAFELDCLANSRLRNSTSIHLSKSPRRTERDRRPLPKHIMDKLRASINAASYAGHLGREVERLFQRFDTDGSGVLEPEEVRLAMRRALKVPTSVITDEQIARLCAQLDADNSGSISIPEIVAFLGKEPSISKRTGKESVVDSQMRQLQAELDGS